MLDVHAPHSPTHTWKDFFIHIATICIGLLIAIGLEQTVEAIHHKQGDSARALCPRTIASQLCAPRSSDITQRTVRPA